MLRLLRKKLMAINVISIVFVLTVAFSAIFFSFRSAVINQAEKAVDKALDEYSPARTVFLPEIPVQEDFYVTVELFEKPPQDENIIFKTKSLPDGSTIIAKCDISEENRLIRRLGATLWASGIILTVLIFLISLSVSKKATKPVLESMEIQRQFASDISHELKTPLSAISANLDLINADDEQKKWLDNIRFETDRMIRLTKHMLKLFSGSTGTDFSIISLSEICQNAALSFEAVAFESKLEMKTNISDGIFIRGNREQTEQLVSILTDNAIKYNHAGGFVEITLKAKHMKALLTVENTGTPIPDPSAVFRRFYREDSSRSREGFGLGLSIAYKIVSDLGGKIWAKSGKTNIFSVNFRVEKKVK